MGDTAAEAVLAPAVLLQRARSCIRLRQVSRVAVGMLFLPVSKAYAGPVSGGSPGSGEMRGVWVSYLDWNGWAKDEAGYKKAMDQTLDLCVQKGLNAVFLQVRPDGDADVSVQSISRGSICLWKTGKKSGV